MKTKLTLALSLLIAITAFSVVPNWRRPAVILAWDYDATNQVNITSFKVYWGVASRDYTNFATVPAAQRSVIVSNLVNNTTYYFSATAVDQYSLESDYSNEVTNTTPRRATPPGQLNATNVQLPF